MIVLIRLLVVHFVVMDFCSFVTGLFIRAREASSVLVWGHEVGRGVWWKLRQGAGASSASSGVWQGGFVCSRLFSSGGTRWIVAYQVHGVLV